MTMTEQDLDTVTPIDRAEAVELGRVEYRRLAGALAALEAAEWQQPTDCEGWTVRDMAGHVLGSMQDHRSLRGVAARQIGVKKRVRRTGELDVDAMTALQLESTASLSTDELVARMRQLADAAADGRCKPPDFIADRVGLPVDLGVLRETWKLSYLLGPILTRDTWLHRVSDLARAVGRQPELDIEHDGRIVTDVAAEWARRHGRPVRLTLTGPVGGRYTAGGGGESAPEIVLDAIEFCRVMSGRAEPTHDLLRTIVPF